MAFFIASVSVCLFVFVPQIGQYNSEVYAVVHKFLSYYDSMAHNIRHEFILE